MLSDRASSVKYKGQRKIEKVGELYTEEEYHKPATQQTTRRRLCTVFYRFNVSMF